MFYRRSLKNMARTLSNWEYRLLLTEARRLLERRLSKIYEIEPGLLRFDFGGDSLIVRPGICFYISDHPPAAPLLPSSFAMRLRKNIEGSRLVAIAPYKSDRLYVLTFANGLRLVFEQFAGGNIVLIDAEGRICFAYHAKPSATKLLKSGSPYVWPDSPEFISPPGSKEWDAMRTLAPETKVLSALSRWPMGKIYVQQALQDAQVDGATKVADVKKEQAVQILSSFSRLLASPQFLVYEHAQGSPAELSLAPLSAYASAEFTPHSFPVWSQAVESYFSRQTEAAAPSEHPDAIRRNKRLLEQEAALARLETEIADVSAQAAWLEAHRVELEGRWHALTADSKNKKLKMKID